MNAREFLEQYKEAVRMVDNLQDEYDEQQQQIDRIRSSLGGDGLPRSGGIRKEVEERAVELAAKADEILLAETYALEIRQSVERVVRKIPGIHGDVIRKRYIDLLRWHEVADAISYSVDHCYTLHREALEITEKIINP